MEVELVHWPLDDDRLEELRSSGRARLLVIDPETVAPVCSDLLEDWIRRPATIPDLQARIAGLEQRMALVSDNRPVIDDCLVRHGGGWVSIPPVEMRITKALLGQFGAVVGREKLLRAGWPGGDADRNALDVHMMRLRRRLSSVGVVVRTVRGRGYLMETRQSQVSESRQRAVS